MSGHMSANMSVLFFSVCMPGHMSVHIIVYISTYMSMHMSIGMPVHKSISCLTNTMVPKDRFVVCGTCVFVHNGTCCRGLLGHNQ